jgi:hypothetical protein
VKLLLIRKLSNVTSIDAKCQEKFRKPPFTDLLVDKKTESLSSLLKLLFATANSYDVIPILADVVVVSNMHSSP